MFDYFERWGESVNKEMSAGGTAAQIRRSFIVCVVWTVMLLASIAIMIVAFVLHVRTFQKLIDASAIVLSSFMLVVLWQFYFWIKRRVLEKERAAAIK